MLDEPKPRADDNPERWVCPWCGWDSMWPEATPSPCFACTRQRLKRGHAAGRIVDEDDGTPDAPGVA